MQKNLTISLEHLHDITFAHTGVHAWRKGITEKFGDCLEHPIISKFRHFMTAPVALVLFEENGVIEAATAMARVVTIDATDDIEINPNRDILYTLVEDADGVVVSMRYATFDKDVLVVQM